MKHLIVTCFVLITLAGCTQSNSQTGKKKSIDAIRIGGSCENCDAIYTSPVPFEKLDAVDTLPDFMEGGPKICISGTIYHSDGRTPAPGVILYVYHTDQTGRYVNKKGEKGSAGRNGYIKGWVKSNEKGAYKFYTLKPAAYPGGNVPAHIHPLIKEPGRNEYWIDEFLFDDDPFLTKAERNKQQGRGGNGIIKFHYKDGLLQGERNIILGRNIPDYPVKNVTTSGLEIGEDCPAFDPVHITGADKGKHACPMCKYGSGQGIMIWMNHSNFEGMESFLQALDMQVSERSEKNFRVFIVYMNPLLKKGRDEQQMQKAFQEWFDGQNLRRIALVWIPSPTDDETAGNYRINPDAKNTVFMYRQREVVSKWVNMKYDCNGFGGIMNAVKSYL